SLLATQVVARTRKAFQVDLPLLRIFETPTVAGLAQAIEQMRQVPVAKPSGIRRVSREQYRFSSREAVSLASKALNNRGEK
ncbi:MAG: phosphopantetheine-binding protein, partial [Chloroflexota bacterium]